MKRKRKEHSTRSQYHRAENTTRNNPKKTLIINHLAQTPPATTGNKPAKPEMKNKPNMNPTHNQEVNRYITPHIQQMQHPTNSSPAIATTGNIPAFHANTSNPEIPRRNPLKTERGTYTIDTSLWSEKVRNIYEEHFGKLPEKETVHTIVADEKPLILKS